MISASAEKLRSMPGANARGPEPGFGFERYAENADSDNADASMGSYQEGWFISYIDILTLLLTLFVILLAMSHFKPEIAAVQESSVSLNAPVKQDPGPVAQADESKTVSGRDEISKQQDAGKPQVAAGPAWENSINAKIPTEEIQESPAVPVQQKNVQLAQEQNREQYRNLSDTTASADEMIATDLPEQDPNQNLDQNEAYQDVGLANPGDIAEGLFAGRVDAAKIFPMHSVLAELDNEMNTDGRPEGITLASALVEETNHEQKMSPSPRERSNALMEQIKNSELGQQIEISEAQGQVNLEISDHILFAPGSAELKPEGLELLGQLAVMINDTRLNMSVEGHTDNVPIHNAQYPSNWELSTARATTVTRYLIANNIAPGRVRAIGYADTHPRADNNTVEGRESNRRVSIVLHMPEADTLPDALVAASQ